MRRRPGAAGSRQSRRGKALGQLAAAALRAAVGRHGDDLGRRSASVSQPYPPERGARQRLEAGRCDGAHPAPSGDAPAGSGAASRGSSQSELDRDLSWAPVTSGAMPRRLQREIFGERAHLAGPPLEPLLGRRAPFVVPGIIVVHRAGSGGMADTAGLRNPLGKLLPVRVRIPPPACVYRACWPTVSGCLHANLR